MISFLKTTFAILFLSATAALAQYEQYAPENEDALNLLRAGKFQDALAIIVPLAESGDARAQSNLSTIYDQGFGVEADQAQALRWAKLAAAQNFAPAMYNLAVMYGQGRGLPEDKKKALRLLTGAAGQDYAPALFYLGVVYTRGDGVEKDEVAAFGWFSAAARKGVARAQYQLITAYAKGAGVAPDPVLAYMWAVIAAENGMQPAIDNLEAFASALPAEIVAEARRRAKLCLDSAYADCS